MKHSKGTVMKSSQMPTATRALASSILNIVGIATLLASAWVSSSLAEPGYDNRAPEVPTSLEVPAGNKVSFHVFAVGVQIYRAAASTNSPTGFAWTFVGPEAVLFDMDGNVVGTHYAFAGPTRPAWETTSGSRVVGIRTVAPVTVDPTAIPWLILSADPVNTIGPGVLERTTYIQRVNTTGGLAPSAPPTQLGQEVQVPYTTEYYFYRATN